MFYVLNDVFLSNIAKYIERIEALRAQLWQILIRSLLSILTAITRVSLLRLLFLLLKRVIAIIKSVFKYFVISLSIPALDFLYILHFARAFLRIINFFQENNNKNAGEIIKLLLSIFKVAISLLMLSVLIVATIYGGGSLLFLFSLPIYGALKTSFRVYSGTKCLISLVTLIATCYRREFVSKKRNNDAEDHWLKEQYKDNYYKHVPILLIGLSTTILLSILSFMGIAGLGPVGFIVIIVLTCLFLSIDIIKSIYDFRHSTKVPEPEVGSLPQKNAFIDDSYGDYYWRKCRVARLSGDYEKDIVYLLKEILVKKKCLENEMGSSLQEKILAKIAGLEELSILLLTDNGQSYSADIVDTRLANTIESLKKDKEALNKADKLLLSKDDIEKLIKEQEKFRSKFAIAANEKKGMRCSKLLRQLIFRNKKQAKLSIPLFGSIQSFFRKIGDYEDIEIAVKKHLENNNQLYQKSFDATENEAHNQGASDKHTLKQGQKAYCYATAIKSFFWIPPQQDSMGPLRCRLR